MDRYLCATRWERTNVAELVARLYQPAPMRVLVVEVSMKFSAYSPHEKAVKLQSLAAQEGVAIQDMLEKASFDSLAPCICMVCSATDELEPDQREGYCTECGNQTMVSCLVLANLV